MHNREGQKKPEFRKVWTWYLQGPPAELLWEATILFSPVCAGHYSLAGKKEPCVWFLVAFLAYINVLSPLTQGVWHNDKGSKQRQYFMSVVFVLRGGQMGQFLCYPIFSTTILKFPRQEEIWFTYGFPSSYYDWWNKMEIILLIRLQLWDKQSLLKCIKCHLQLFDQVL